MYIGSLSCRMPYEAAVRSGDGSRASGARAAADRRWPRRLLGARPAGARAALMAPVRMPSRSTPEAARPSRSLWRAHGLSRARDSYTANGCGGNAAEGRTRAAAPSARKCSQAMGRGHLRTGRRSSWARPVSVPARSRRDTRPAHAAGASGRAARGGGKSPTRNRRAAVHQPFTRLPITCASVNKLSVSSRNQLAKALGEPLQPSPQSV